MCGRYCLSSAPEAIRALFRYPEQPNFPPRYNVAPTQPVPIVRMVEGRRQFALVRWGLVPAWVEDPRAFSLLINARSESVNDKPAFKNAMKRRRCFFPADGFYEWKAGPTGKRPYFARPRAGSPIAFAGLWETWIGPNGEEMETAAILTTTANAETGQIHSRAPVIIPPEQFDFWLDCRNVDEGMASELLAPAPDESMDVYEISNSVNRVANDSPELIAAVAPSASIEEQTTSYVAPKPRKTKIDTRQGSLF